MSVHVRPPKACAASSRNPLSSRSFDSYRTCIANERLVVGGHKTLRSKYDSDITLSNANIQIEMVPDQHLFRSTDRYVVQAESTCADGKRRWKVRLPVDQQEIDKMSVLTVYPIRFCHILPDF